MPARLLPRRQDAGDRQDDDDDVVQLWDVASGQLKATLTGCVRAARLLPRRQDAGDRGLDDTPRQLWDVASGQLKASLTGSDGPLAFSPDGQTLATTGAR